jgi:Mg-chelatase subunit ChlD
MLSVFVALDRSGSMNGPSWNNAIESLNEYVGGLQSEKIEGDITIIAFDAGTNMEVRLVPLVENKSIAYFEKLNREVLDPSGMTPLYDAAANVMDRALQRNNERTVVVILTDGHENASKEYTQASIKSKVAQLQAKKWEVIFLGANFDVEHYTKQAGLDMTKMRNFDINNAAERNTMTADLRTSTIAYTTAGTAMNLSGSK